MASALLDLDPTGTLSAVGAGVSLVGAALRLGTAAKKLNDTRGGGGGGGTTGAAGHPNYHRSQTNPGEVTVVPRDPERERRAYETVNFVLRELGSRICAAGMVDEHALTKALTAAAQHIEVNLFSGEANRLFESLAPKLDDPILVNSVFTSIYFIGALSAELSTSLPNYKDTYTPVGPRLVQQLFRAAIGEDAFRDNLSANLDAYKTLTTTAGLLRPTDIGYATFPRFPTFSPCKYSSKGFSDVRLNRTTYDKLVKHFERVGFPQPTPTRQVEVGVIRDWKFLCSDSNSRAFEVDRADKNIGENFGRVVHWLICNAERLPPGTAMIAYYDQHIELIKWIQHRMGYAVLYPTIDLDLGGPHTQLERRLRMTIESWVILMPSEAAQAAKRANAEHWMSTHIRTAAQAPPFVVSGAAVPRPTSIAVPPSTQIPLHTSQSPPPTAPAPFSIAHAAPPTSNPPSSGYLPTNEAYTEASHSPPPASHATAQYASAPRPAPQTYPPMTQGVQPSLQGAPPMRQPSQASSHSASGVSATQSTNRAVTTVPTSPPMSSASSPPRSPAAIEMPTQGQSHFIPKLAYEQQVEEIDQQFRSALVPQVQRLWSNPSADAGIRDSQCKVLEHTLERETIDRLDRIEVPENSPARWQRKRLIDQAQELMDFLPIYKELGATATHGRTLPGALQAFAQQAASSSVSSAPAPRGPQNTGPVPHPYSPESSRPPESNASLSTNPVPENPKPIAIRRKAPPPPKKIIVAKALYDFEPDAENEEELGFNEDDDLEIVEKTPAMDEDGWCKARVKGSKKVGLVPLEYLKIEEKKDVPGPTRNRPGEVPAGAHPEQNLSRGLSAHGNSTAPSLPATHQSPGTTSHVPPGHFKPNVPTYPSSGHQASGNPHQASIAHHQPNISIHPGSAPTAPSAQSVPYHHLGGSPHLSSAHPQINSAPPNHVPNHTLAHPPLPHQPNTVNSPHSVPHQSPHSPTPSSSLPNANNAHGRVDTAGLAAAAIGTVAGAGALMKGVGRLEEKRNHSSGHIGSPSHQCNYLNPGQSNNGGTVYVADPPPMVDLSAFGEAPFDPRNATIVEDQYYVPQETFAQQAPQASYTVLPTTNYLGGTPAVQDTSTTSIVDSQDVVSSPFATMSTTDTTTITDTTITSGDGVTTTYETYSDDQTYSVDDNDYGSD